MLQLNGIKNNDIKNENTSIKLLRSPRIAIINLLERNQVNLIINFVTNVTGLYFFLMNLLLCNCLLHWALYQENLNVHFWIIFWSWWNHSQLRFNWTKQYLYIYIYVCVCIYIYIYIYNGSRKLPYSAETKSLKHAASRPHTARKLCFYATE